MRILKIAILITSLFCLKQSFSQNYHAYYKGINSAKVSLLEDSLEKGVNQYFETFEKFEFVFARDCFNALEVACRIGDQNKTNYFFERCLIQGIDFTFLEKDSMLTDFKQSEAWTDLLLVKDSLRSVYEANVNWELRKEVNSIFAEDQRIRDLANKNRFNILKIRGLNKQFEEIDRKLILRLMELTKEHGFPGEKLIGIDANSMHPKITERYLTAGIPIVIFIHHYSQPNKSYNSLLRPEIEKGNLLNEHFATISDFQYTYGIEKKDSLCHSTMFRPKLTQEIINKNRNEIYLPTLTQKMGLSRKKIITPRYYLY